jgi:hypothetical protein
MQAQPGQKFPRRVRANAVVEGLEMLTRKPLARIGFATVFTRQATPRAGHSAWTRGLP